MGIMESELKNIAKETLIKIIANEMNLTIGETNMLIKKLADYVERKEEDINDPVE